MYSKDDFRAYQDKQLELETIERIYDDLNSKFFDNKLQNHILGIKIGY